MITNAQLSESSPSCGDTPEENALYGDLTIPGSPLGLVIFLHASGRSSPTDLHAASALNKKGFATLLLDLLTQQEQKIDSETMEFRFDVPLLAMRSISITNGLLAILEREICLWVCSVAALAQSAALIAASVMNRQIAAVVSRGGRPDLAEEALAQVSSPTLLNCGQ